MKQASRVKNTRKTDRERIAEVDLDSLSEAQLRDLYEEIFGEPSDEEIAETLREAEAESKAGLYTPPKRESDASTEDDEPYREPTRQEILQGIKRGYMQALAGETRPIEDLFKELKDS